MPAKHNADQAFMGGDRFLQNQPKVKSRPLPINPPHRIAVDFVGQLPTVAASGDGNDGVRVSMIDVVIGDKGMERRINRTGARV